MGIAVIIALVVTGAGVTVDAWRLKYDKRDLKGWAAMGPVGWGVCAMLLWPAGPLFYLYGRRELKAAAELRHKRFQGDLPPARALGPGPAPR